MKKLWLKCLLLTAVLTCVCGSMETSTEQTGSTNTENAVDTGGTDNNIKDLVGGDVESDKEVKEDIIIDTSPPHTDKETGNQDNKVPVTDSQKLSLSNSVPSQEEAGTTVDPTPASTVDVEKATTAVTPQSTASTNLDSSVQEPVAESTVLVHEDKSIAVESSGPSDTVKSEDEKGTNVRETEGKSEEKVKEVKDTQDESAKVVPVSEPQQPSGQSQSTGQGEVTQADQTTEQQDEKDKETEESSEKDKDFETFTEWRQKTLAEEQEKSKGTADENSAGTKLSMKKQKKNNYASKECGAKVVAANPESENANRALTSLKDDYMINPCKAKKWFIVELCEPVHVKSVEMASLELFSSQPKTFKLSFSDRYPSKEWQNSQQFEMTEERNPQPFDVDFPDDFYVKYVKVEMLEHYGEEHYCPLTLFKLYGIPVELDDYDSHQEEDTDGDMDAEILNNGEDGSEANQPKTLVHSVKESVMKLVKKVLNVEEKGEGSQGSNDTVVQQNGTSANDTTVNMTSKGGMLPCVPDARYDSGDKSQTEKTGAAPTRPSVPKATADQVVELPCVIPNVQEEDIQPQVLDPDVSMVTKLEDHEQLPSEQMKNQMVTLIQSGDFEHIGEIYSDCFHTALAQKSSNSTSLKCVYFRLMTKKPFVQLCPAKTGSVKVEKDRDDLLQSIPQKKLEKPEGKQSTIVVIDNTASQSPEVKVEEPPVSQEVSADSVAETEIMSTESVKTTEATDVPSEAVSQVHIPVTEDKTEVKKSDESQNQKHEDIKPAKAVDPEIQSTLVDSNTKDSKHMNKSDDKTSQGDILLEPSQTPVPSEESSVTMETPVLKVTQTDVPGIRDQESKTSAVPQSEDKVTVQNEPETAKQQLPEVKAASIVTVPSLSNTPPVEGATVSETPLVDASNLSLIRGEEEDKVVKPAVDSETFDKPSPQRDLGLVRIPVVPLQKRETAIMRLTNRIKILETNVSLSSRFLDQMTQKFKKQSNETLKLLNAKFDNLTREAEMRDQRQQEQINVLESKLQNLTSMVYTLQDNMRLLNQQVTDRQMVWTTIEVVILCVIFLLCLRRSKSTGQILPPEVKRLLDTMPSSLDVTDGLVPRRNSFSGETTKTPAITIGASLQKHSSDTALANNPEGQQKKGAIEDSYIMRKDSANHRKRKKKKKVPEFKPPSSTEEENIGPCHMESSSAGLLFGSTASKPVTTNQSFNQLSHSKSHVGFWSLFGDKSDPKPRSSSIGATANQKESACHNISKEELSRKKSDAPHCKPTTVKSLHNDGNSTKHKKNGCPHFAKSHLQNSVSTLSSNVSCISPTFNNVCSENWKTSGSEPPIQPSKNMPAKKKMTHQRASSADFSPKKNISKPWGNFFGLK